MSTVLQEANVLGHSY